MDVAVIGGRIACRYSAWELAASGRSVTVLEGDRIAADASGCATAN
ncbi:hypothetical protein [Streptomyces sp. NBC_01198]